MTGLTFEYIVKRDSKPAHCFSAFVKGQGYVNDGNDPDTQADYNEQLQRARDSERENIRFASDYSEPGYSTPEAGVLFANWNCFSKQLATVLEHAGYEIEWSDEWDTCGNCYKAVRTQADGYDWQPYYTVSDGELTCLDCIDWPEYLESIEDDSNSCCVATCNPGEHGYVLISEPNQYESGFHPGQTDKPGEILKQLHKAGKTGLVFRLGESSQFYVRFEVWQRIDQDTLAEQLEDSELNSDSDQEQED